jgi:hypothetical protein
VELLGEITSRFSVFTNQMNQNLRRINMRNGGLTCLEQVATQGDLPATPSDGDTYVATSTKTVWTWYDNPGTWESTQLYIPDIFWDQNNLKFYYYNGTNITELLTATIPPPNYDMSDSSGNFSTTNDTPTDVTNLEVTLTSTGNPIDLYVSGDGSNNQSYFGIRNTSAVGTEAKGYIDILRDAVVIQTIPLYLMAGNVSGDTLWLQVPSTFNIKDEIAAGTYTYKVQAYIDSAVDPDQVIEVYFAKLVAEERK